MLRMCFTLPAVILVGTLILTGCEIADQPNLPIANDSTMEEGSAEASAVLAAPSATQ